jgi:hypothetical protein
MWIFTEFGFFSAVAHRDLPEHLMIRGRFKDDIKQLARMGRLIAKDKTIKVMSTPSGDYPYRTVMRRDTMAAILEGMAQEIDYDNFKNHVHGEPDRDTALMRIWNAMYEAGEEREPRHTVPVIGQWPGREYIPEPEDDGMPGHFIDGRDHGDNGYDFGDYTEILRRDNEKDDERRRPDYDEIERKSKAAFQRTLDDKDRERAGDTDPIQADEDDLHGLPGLSRESLEAFQAYLREEEHVHQMKRRRSNAKAHRGNHRKHHRDSNRSVRNRTGSLPTVRRRKSRKRDQAEG